LILDRADLSQRGYKDIKKTLKKQNVILPSYNNVQKSLTTLNIGTIERKFCKCDCCFSCQSKAKETLVSFLRNKFWFTKLKFPAFLQQQKLFDTPKEFGMVWTSRSQFENAFYSPYRI